MYTNACEIYDSLNDNWFSLNAMKTARANTSLVSISDRFVYVFHGLPSGIPTSQQNCIEMIDLGPIDSQSIRIAKWQPICIQNTDFIENGPCGSTQISQTDVLIFGGTNRVSYLLDISNLSNQVRQPPRLSTLPDKSNLLSDSHFCQDSDFRVRIFGNFLYAIDGSLKNLHIHSIKDKEWN